MREIYEKLGHPYQKDFNNLIKYNLINNFPVTLEGANRVKKIYEPNIAALKVNNTHINMDSVVTDYIKVPK